MLENARINRSHHHRPEVQGKYLIFEHIDPTRKRVRSLIKRGGPHHPVMPHKRESLDPDPMRILRTNQSQRPNQNPKKGPSQALRAMHRIKIFLIKS